MDDLISRSAAIAVIGDDFELWNDDSDYLLGRYSQWQEDIDAIRNLPSAERRENGGIDMDTNMQTITALNRVTGIIEGIAMGSDGATSCCLVDVVERLEGIIADLMKAEE